MPLAPHALRTICIGVALSLLWLTSQGQTGEDPSLSRDFRALAPESLPTHQAAEPPAPEVPPKLQEAQDLVLVDAWRGLILVPPSEVKKEGYLNVGDSGAQEGFLFASSLDVPAPATLRAALAPFIGEAMTQSRIDAAIREIILHYRANDRPLVDVYVPEQRMPAGILQIALLEARLGNVRIEGNRYFSSEELLRTIRVQPGERIHQGALLEDINWMNRNPFRKGDVYYQRGTTVGTTDILVEVKDRFPLRLYLGFNDSGNRLTSYETLVTGFNWGRAFWSDDQINYQYTTRLKSRLLRGHSLMYTKLLPWRHTLNLLGSYSESVIDGSRIAFEGVDIHTRSWQLGARYQLPLAFTKVEDHLTLGVDFKRSEDGLGILGIVLPDTVTDITQFSGSYLVTVPIEKGNLSLGASLIYSPGGIGGHNRQATNHLQGDASYLYTRWNAQIVHQLPHGFLFSARGEAQASSDQLAGSEQFAAGGYGTVRGYDASEVVGDNGLLWSAELYGPPLPLAVRFKSTDSTPPDLFQALVFIDYADLSLINPDVNEDPHATLMSIGPGLRYQVRDTLSARLDWGFQLRDSNAARNQRNPRNDRIHLSVQASY